jgi:C-terminal processing protease CtpA/Prc
VTPRRRPRSSRAPCRTPSGRGGGTKTFGKGVFQEVIELSNGGALDITAGQYFTPKGRNLGGKGVSTGAGIKADVAAADDRRPSATRPCPSP